MDRWIRAAILLCFAGVLLCGCGQQRQSQKVVVTDSLAGKPVLVGSQPINFPLTQEPFKMNALSFFSCGPTYDKVFVWNQYEQMTGVEVNWRMAAYRERTEAVYTALVNHEDLDLILRCRISPILLTQYGERGLIHDLTKNDLLKNNAPNCWNYLQSHPDALAAVMNPNGAIYSLPQINSGSELRVMRKIFINKKWLKNVNMELPKTTEDMYRLLKAFKEQDANGNGNPDDEIPLCSRDWLSIQESFSGAFGIMNRGVHNNIVDCDEAVGKVRLTAATPEYRDFLAYFQKLYAEELMDSNIFSMTMEEWYNNAVNDRIGVFCSTNLASLPADVIDDWIGIAEALEGPKGYKLWSAVRANFHSTGNAVIPITCKNPELVLRWLDYFWTDEGTLFYHLGLEGKTFVVKEDGSYDYVPAIYEEMRQNNRSFDDVVAKYTPYPGGGNPTVEIAPYFMGGEMGREAAAAARHLFQYAPLNCWPSFTFTPDENEILNEVNSDIEKYCNDMQISFIVGKRPLSDWDKYLLHLDQLKTQKLLDVYQRALERYEKMSAGKMN